MCVLSVLGCYVLFVCRVLMLYFFFFQAEDGIRDLVRSRGLGDVYKRQTQAMPMTMRVRKSRKDVTVYM